MDANLAREVLDNLADGVVFVDRAGVILYMNPATENLIGVNAVGMHANEYVRRIGMFTADGVTPARPEDLPGLRAMAGDRSVLGEETELVIRNEHVPDGVRISISLSLLESPEEPRGVVILFRNMSERVRHREELKQRETYLHAILDNLPDMAWLKDRDGHFVAVNEPLVRASGLADRDIVGRTDLDVWPRELAERYRADDREVMLARSTKRVEEPFVAADGTVTTIETIKTAIVDDKGDVIGTTGMARDITERKRVEEELRDAKLQLERRIDQRTRELERAQELSVRKERLAVLGQLAGGVAHQIRNPLAAMKNASYVLERSLALVGAVLPPVDESVPRRRTSSSPSLGERGPDGVLRLSPEQQVAQSLAIIHEEIRRANDIISGLLDYARIRAPVRQIVAAREIVRQALSLGEVPERIEVRTEIGDSKLAVDPGQVSEALQVLLRNAVDAMPHAGTLTLTSQDDAAFVILGVEDTGAGVPNEVADRLFEPLLTTKPMGLGLGLVTARTLVEAQGGQLSFVPGQKRGARFEMRLPRGA
jgi:PAS domain S-box-containing protein